MARANFRNTKQFQALCLSIDDDVMFFDDDGLKADVFEDDGTLHVRRYGLRACFDVSRGQEASGREQNERTRAVLIALGLPLDRDRVLVGEADEDDDGYCSHCGRS